MTDLAQMLRDRAAAQGGDKLLEEAAAALEEAREGAERYQWLRDGGLGYLPYDDHGCGPEYPHHEELDAAIDRARGKVSTPSTTGGGDG